MNINVTKLECAPIDVTKLEFLPDNCEKLDYYSVYSVSSDFNDEFPTTYSTNCNYAVQSDKNSTITTNTIWNN